jgi:hypothetical protein
MSVYIEQNVRSRPESGAQQFHSVDYVYRLTWCV